MKKLIAIILVASLFAITASAGLETFNLGTNTVAGSSATNFTTVVTAPKSTDITIQVSSTSASSDTSAKTFVFNGSVDNVIWQPNVLAITYAATGTSRAGNLTNLPPGYRYPYIQLGYVTNASASVRMTNMAAKVWLK